jgi:predicted RNA binding protein YcfA (HicA-like mRNA interferase family)
MRLPPLKHKDAVTALKALGFEPRKSKATSHQQWVKQCPSEVPAFLKVTLDRYNSPYAKDLLASIVRQAGVSKKEFYRAAGLM